MESKTRTDSVQGHPGTVASLVLVSKRELVLVRQYRPMFGASLLELPGGLIEPGESALEAAEREVMEETGYSVMAVIPLGVFAATVGYSDERIHLFAGRVDTSYGRRPLGAGEQEVLTIVGMDLHDALSDLASSQLADAKTQIGLLAYAARIDEIWEDLQRIG